MFIPTNLVVIRDPFPFLQVFTDLVRAVVLSANRLPIQKRSVEQYLRSVGGIFVAVGTRNPRFDTFGRVNFRLFRNLAVYTRQDPSPSRVLSIQISILHFLGVTEQSVTPLQHDISDLTWIACFFLLHPV